MMKQIDARVHRCLKKVRELRLRIEECRKQAEAAARWEEYRCADNWNAEACRLEEVVLMVQANARRLSGLTQPEVVTEKDDRAELEQLVANARCLPQ